MWRDCSACGGEIEPVICFNGAVSISGCAPLRSFPQVYRNKPRRIAVKKRCDIFEKLPTNILGCRHLVPEREGIFVQKAMVVAIVNDFTGAFLNLADVDQHSGGRIGLTGKNKVSHIVASGAVTRGAFFTEKPAVLFCGEFRYKQSARSGEFNALADGQQHDAANPTTRNRANDPRVFRSERVVCLQPAEAHAPRVQPPVRLGPMAPSPSRTFAFLLIAAGSRNEQARTRALPDNGQVAYRPRQAGSLSSS